MIAFLKRRWLMLSCALVLTACSIVDVRWELPRLMIGVCEGEFGCTYFEPIEHTWWFYLKPSEQPIHSPAFGTVPRFSSFLGGVFVSIPVWLPLSIVVAWITFRELRWREKRAKAADSLRVQT